jgi:maltose alpha-D-glucosyltransferase/alpha-amylase
VNPDLEVGRFLTDRAKFEHIAPVAGGLELKRGRGPATTLGVLHGYVPNEGDAWSYTEDRVRNYLESVLARAAARPEIEVPSRSLFDVVDEGPPELAAETMGDYLGAARLLGRRTAELHLALASERDDPAFAPERVTAFYQRSLYQSLRGIASRTFSSAVARGCPAPDRARTAAEVPGVRSVLDVKISGRARAIATSTSGRCSTRDATSPSSTSRASPPGRSASAGSSGSRSSTSRA